MVARSGGADAAASAVRDADSLASEAPLCVGGGGAYRPPSEAELLAAEAAARGDGLDGVDAPAGDDPRKEAGSGAAVSRGRPPLFAASSPVAAPGAVAAAAAAAAAAARDPCVGLPPGCARKELHTYTWREEGAVTGAGGVASLVVVAALPARCNAGGARARFETRTADVWAVASSAQPTDCSDGSDGQARGTAFRLRLDKLYRDIDVVECSARLSRDRTRLIVTLVKKDGRPWRMLRG